MNSDFVERVKIHEGFRSKAYYDTTGHLTIGYGWNIHDGISKEAAEAILIMQLRECMAKVTDLLRRNGITVSTVRKEVLAEMCFNLGLHGLMGFRKMWEALREGNYDKAADEMLDSKWYKQVGTRALTLSKLMRTG